MNFFHLAMDILAHVVRIAHALKYAPSHLLVYACVGTDLQANSPSYNIHL
jgi:hypothetical protein